MRKILLLIAALATLSVGVFAQCATFPCVVASTSLTDQREGVPTTILYTPTVEGTFRINVYLTTGIGTNGAGHWDVFLRWADGIRARNTVLSAFEQKTNVPFGTVVVHDIAGQPLEYRTANSAGSKRYDLYIVVEQLQ